MVSIERAKPSLAGLLSYWLFLMCTERYLFALSANAQPSTKALTSNQAGDPSVQNYVREKRSNSKAHFGILLDAGSTSTKSKVYRWVPSASHGILPVVELIKTQRFKPALADFRNDQEGLSKYLADILSEAKQVVPEDEYSITPISVMATAGLRFMSGPAVQSLLQMTRSVLSNASVNPFQFSDTGRVTVLSGEEEGIYSWIAANYLRGFFEGHKSFSESVGVLEMGGGSTQITFMPKGPLFAEEFQVIIAGKRYNLYVQSYLQFGINGIKAKVAQHLSNLSPRSTTVDNPCMLRDDTGVLELKVDTKLTMKGTGDPEECEEILSLVLKPDTGYNCQPKPCAIGSVYQPALPNITFYATQAFTYAPKNLKAVDENKILDIERLRERAIYHCNRTLAEAERDSKMDKRFASSDCVSALYMTVLLTKSYGFKKDTTDIKVTSKIGGQSIDWALGAMLMEISSNISGDKTQYSVTCKPETITYTKGENNMASHSVFSYSKLIVTLSFFNLSFLFY